MAPTNPDRPRPPRARAPRRLLLVPLLWALVTGVSGRCVQLTWAAPGTPEHPVSATARAVSRFTQAASLPVWWPAWRIFRLPLGEQAFAYPLAGAGWGLWVAALLVAATLVRRAPRAPGLRRAPDLGRRRFLGGALLEAGAGGLGTAATGSLITPFHLRIQRLQVPVRGLPPSLDNLRIVHITDTHLGAWVGRDFLDRAIAAAISLSPDLYALTGDYVHMRAGHVAPAAEVFRPLVEDRRALGVLGVLGNHDHYAGADASAAALTSVGIRMLDNDRVFLDAATRRLTASRPASGLCLAGLGDLWEGLVDPGRALREVPADLPRIVLAHNPDTAEILAERAAAGAGAPPRVDLMLSGHMHGGQVRLPLVGILAIPSRYGLKYAQGLVQSPVGPVLVSAGLGMSFVPIRLGVRPELIEITLTRAV